LTRRRIFRGMCSPGYAPHEPSASAVEPLPAPQNNAILAAAAAVACRRRRRRRCRCCWHFHFHSRCGCRRRRTCASAAWRCAQGGRRRQVHARLADRGLGDEQHGLPEGANGRGLLPDPVRLRSGQQQGFECSICQHMSARFTKRMFALGSGPHGTHTDRREAFGRANDGAVMRRCELQ